MRNHLIIFLLMTLLSYSAEYGYPYKDRYIATVLSTPNELEYPGSKNIRIREYNLKNKTKDIPKNLWFLKKYSFGLVKQKKRAPLMIVVAGTGATYKSGKTQKLAKILDKRGYHVLMITSPANSNFVVSQSKSHMPGDLIRDGGDLYQAIVESYEKIKNKIDVSDIYLTGYSLGGTNSIVLGAIDEKVKYFNFKRIYAFNPSVNLYESAKRLDKLLDDTVESEKDLEILVDRILTQISISAVNAGSLEFDKGSMIKLLTALNIGERELKAAIGIFFRIFSIDVNYLSDLLTSSGLYTPSDYVPKKHESMLKYFKRIDYSNFTSYMNNIVLPAYLKEGYVSNKKELLELTSLHQLRGYLRRANNLAVVTNEDEIILGAEDFTFLKNNLGNRLKLYPTGGHCGNMFYYKNVQDFLNFIEKGELNWRN